MKRTRNVWPPTTTMRRMTQWALIAVVLTACTSPPGFDDTARNESSVAGQIVARLSAARSADGSTRGGVRTDSVLSQVAMLPDHGELTAPAAGRQPEEADGYRWYPVDISEAHALESLSSGMMELRAPDGRRLKLRYARHVEHKSGDWSWIGRLDGADSGMNDVLLTFGARAVFGQVPLPGYESPPLKLAMRHGSVWMGEASFKSLASAAKPYRVSGGTDGLPTPPRTDPESDEAISIRSAAARAAALSASEVDANAVAGKPTVDVLIGYTSGFRAAFGSDSATVTRLNNVVDDMNVALANSGVNGRVRLVATTYVTYPDKTPPAGSDRIGVALEDLTGTEGHPVPASLQALHGSLRDKYGADLVSLMVKGGDANAGCGVAWQIQTSDAAHEQQFGYSSLSSGCEHALKHELGHNMGLSHDHDNADSNGFAPYGFGYRTTQPDGVGFCTTMAYQFTAATPNAGVYSTPLRKFKGLPTGNASNADNARLLATTFPVAAQFRATRISAGARSRNDANGGGHSDILLRNQDSRRFGHYRMDGAHVVVAPTSQAFGNGDSLVATGDFNGDGKVDVIWRTAGSNFRLWRGNGSSWTSGLIDNPAVQTTTQAVGAADVDGDGRDELLFVLGHSFTFWDINLWSAPTRHSTFSAPSGYKLLSVGDLNGDGRADLLWLTPSRTLTIWWSNGQTFGSARTMLQMAPLAKGTSVFAVGDVTGDGQSELLLFNSSSRSFGRRRLHGDKVEAVSASTMVSPGTLPVASGDYNADGRTDVLWRTSAGVLKIWLDGSASKSLTVDRQPASSTSVVKGGLGGT